MLITFMERGVGSTDVDLRFFLILKRLRVAALVVSLGFYCDIIFINLDAFNFRIKIESETEGEFYC